jgi:glycosyltransferase involved in cell wall biosynthesis
VRVTCLIDSLIAGGAERSLALLTREYVKRDIDVDVVYLYDRDNVWLAPIRDAGVKVFSAAGPYGTPGLIRRVRSLLSERRPDLLHTTLFDADVVGRLAALGKGTTVVSSLVNEAYGIEQSENPGLHSYKLRAAQLIDAVTARRVRRFHAVSNSVAERMAGKLRVPRDRIDVIPRGRDPKELGENTAARRGRVRQSLALTDDDKMILAIGRHEYQKGFDVLLQAVAGVQRNVRARLVIAGREGNETGALERQAEALGLDVEFLGFRTDVPDLLCAADVFVSGSRWEGSPGAVIEAMALQTPIVATSIAPIQEVLGGTAGESLVATDDVAALTAAIVDALDGDQSEGLLTERRERFLESFTLDRCVADMITFYERALG